MNKKAKKLAKENEKLDKNISEESSEKYIDMVVYIRGSQLSDYNQEVVRQDIINMIIDGENRGDSIDTIIGEDYKTFCDEIIDVFPKKTEAEKFRDRIQLLLMCLYVLGAISIIFNTVENIIAKNPWTNYTLTLGDVVDFAIFIAIASFVVDGICKGAFNPPKFKSKVLEFFALWAIMVLIIGVAVGVNLLLKKYAVTFNILIAIAIYVAAFVGSKIIDNIE